MEPFQADFLSIAQARTRARLRNERRGGEEPLIYGRLPATYIFYTKPGATQ